MQVVEERDIQNLEKVWTDIYTNNNDLTIYQSYPFNLQSKKGFVPKNPCKAFFSKSYYFILYENDTPLAIAPLLVNKTTGKTEITLQGMFTGAGHLDFIYVSALTYEQFEFLMNSIVSKFGHVSCNFERISEKSKSSLFLQRYFHFDADRVGKDVCVSIPIDPEYNNWYARLSKSTRQSLRTSYNRIRSDQAALDFVFEMDVSVDKKTYRSVKKVFVKRATEYKEIKLPGLKFLMYLVKSTDPVLSFFRHSPKSFYAIVLINGAPAACCFGFRCHDGRLIVPRLSMDTKFKRYSPGGILIHEMMKRFTQQQDILKIRELDLSRGAESYKYAYAGTNHWNYSYKTDLGV